MKMLNLNDFDSVNYLSDLVIFLQSFSWIFEVSNTLYIKAKILQQNEKFLNFFSFENFLNLSESCDEYPQEVKEFIKNLNSFKINFDVIETNSWKYKNNQNKLSMKKLYEIENIGRIIKDECEDVDVLMDLGSGLGYLDEHLFTNFNFKIIGLEGSEKLHLKALERQQKFCKNSINHVQHLHHFVTDQSGDFIIIAAKKFLKSENVKIGFFGLHPCGDLSVTSFDLFLKNDEIKTLIITPCCYHRMSGADEEFTTFKKFPLSEGLKEIFGGHPKNPFNRCFLRLAGQQSPEKSIEMTPEEHFMHGKEMFERGVVEAILNDDEMIKRIKSEKTSNERLKFDDIKSNFKIFKKSSNEEISWTQNHKEKFQKIRRELPEGEEQSEILSCLQASIQSCCENLVIIDRVLYIKEKAEEKNLKFKIEIKKLQNEKLSPRCHVFVVKKEMK